MITLKDYIGKVYKEVTNAKVQSDIETLAIAQEYAANPLLKHFSVPNIRIKNMELTIPVAIDATQATSRDYTEREVQDVYINAFKKTYLSFYPDKETFIESIKPQLVIKSQELAANTASDLKLAKEEVSQSTTEPIAETDTTVRTSDSPEAVTATSSAESISENYLAASNKAAIQFADVCYNYVSSDIPRDDFYAVIIPDIESNLEPRPYVLEELPVIIETQKLKLINDPASMINIKVNIIDDAMEWTTDVDADGNATPVLNYE
jgi:hypothetical protein